MALTMYKRLGDRTSIATPKRNLQLTLVPDFSDEESEQCYCEIRRLLPLEMRLCAGEEVESKAAANAVIPLSMKNKWHVEALAQLIPRTLRNRSDAVNILATNERRGKANFKKTIHRQR